MENFFKSNSNYPTNFPNIFNDIDSTRLKPGNFSTLKSNTEVDDDIINTILEILTIEANNTKKMEILTFNTLFVSKTLNKGKISMGNRKWIANQDIWKFKIWV